MKPTIRIVSLIGVALLVLYALGRWDARVSAEFRELRDDTRIVLALGKVARRRSDSLRLLEREAIDQAALRKSLEDRLETRLEELSEMDSTETIAARDLSVEDLLPSLRLAPIRSDEGGFHYGTDSSGVRFLANRMLRLDQLERRLPVVVRLAESRDSSLTLWQAAAAAAQVRADSAESRVVALEGLLEEWQATTSCKILWLIPCPSRGLAFVGGAAATIAILVVSK